jgi:hypothetical protein
MRCWYGPRDVLGTSVRIVARVNDVVAAVSMRRGMDPNMAMYSIAAGSLQSRLTEQWIPNLETRYR